MHGGGAAVRAAIGEACQREEGDGRGGRPVLHALGQGALMGGFPLGDRLLGGGLIAGGTFGDLVVIAASELQNRPGPAIRRAPVVGGDRCPVAAASDAKVAFLVSWLRLLHASLPLGGVAR